MSLRDEVIAGLNFIADLVRPSGCALSHERLGDRRIYYFELKRIRESINFTLSEEFLSDLPGTPSHREHTTIGLAILTKRLQNLFPNDFYAVSGTPFNTHIKWPPQHHPSRDVLWLKVDVTNIRFPDLIAKTAAVIDLFLDEYQFKFAPFNRIATVVNAIRSALDKSQIEFYGSKQHPSLLQEIAIMDLPTNPRFKDEAIQQFLAAKVYWLGFGRGDKSTSVWIADVWDALYLGASTGELRRAAQVLQARRLIKLSSDGEFAKADDSLIMAPPSTQAVSARNPIGFVR